MIHFQSFLHLKWIIHISKVWSQFFFSFVLFFLFHTCRFFLLRWCLLALRLQSCAGVFVLSLMTCNPSRQQPILVDFFLPVLPLVPEHHHHIQTHTHKHTELTHSHCCLLLVAHIIAWQGWFKIHAGLLHLSHGSSLTHTHTHTEKYSCFTVKCV